MAGQWQNQDVPPLNGPLINHSRISVRTHGDNGVIQNEETEVLKMKKILVAAIAGSFIAMTAQEIQAFPSGGNKDPKKTETPSPKKIKCKRGYTAKLVKKKYACLKLNAGIVPDAELYHQARALADAGEYEWALEHLRVMSDQNDPEVLNETGYANRKAGRIETGIGYYQRALAINPDFVQAREYLGEAYVLTGFKARAEEQLTEIANRCGIQCEEYKALQNFMLEASR
jgi:tetratricopeptide (TPR) repeat protein